MNNKEIIDLVGKIENKFEKLISVDDNFKFRYFLRLWEFLRTRNVFTAEIIESIINDFDLKLKEQVNCESVSNNDADSFFSYGWTYYTIEVGGTERDIAMFIRVMDKISKPSSFSKPWIEEILKLVTHYTESSSSDKNENLNRFFHHFLAPILEDVKEKLNQKQFIIHSLVKFKKKYEWFNKEILNETYIQDTKKGELNLKKLLYQHLFENNIEFTIEPTSASGEIDFLIEQIGENRIGCEVKIFKEDKNTIKNGIRNQLISYLIDHNLSTGYLIVFNLSNNVLRFNLQSHLEQCYIEIENKRIYIITINSMPFTASKIKGNPLIFGKKDLC